MKQIRCALSTLFLIVVATALEWPRPPLPPRLVDQCGREVDPRSAPVIIVGVIESDSVVLRPVPMHSDGRTPLQMRKMRVGIENVIRGEIKDEHVEVFYFTWGGGFDGPQPLGMWNVGSRRILWLRRDGAALRTACDGWDGCTWGVYSGSHPHLKIEPGESTDRALADVVLTRGEGQIDEARFAGAISRGAPAPDSYLIEHYRRLAATERAGVKAAACEALWIFVQDRSLRDMAEAGMQQANCRCRVVEHGGIDCGPKGYVHDDPPY